MWDLKDTYRVLGIQEFRTGRHVLLDDQGNESSSGFVSAIWKAAIKPTRQIRSILIVVQFEGREDPKATASRVGLRGAYVTRGCNVISRLRSDPVMTILRETSPAPQDSMTLDGISYELTVESDVRYEIDFDNPPRSSQRHRIQCAMFYMASEILDGAGNESGSEAIEIWRRHIYPSGPP